MSIAGYLARRTAELRMPGTADSLGIYFEGTVLTGEKSVEHQQRDEAIRPHDTTRESYKTTPSSTPIWGNRNERTGRSGPLRVNKNARIKMCANKNSGPFMTWPALS
jgi:hypothetical protein